MFKKNSLEISILLLGVILFGGAAAFASGTRNVTLPDNVVLQGKRLPTGECTITWFSHSPELTVTVSNGKKVLATVSAMLVERNKAYGRDTVVVSTRADGTRALRAIGFAGSGQAIVFDRGGFKETEQHLTLPASLGESGLGTGSASSGARKQMAR